MQVPVEPFHGGTVPLWNRSMVELFQDIYKYIYILYINSCMVPQFYCSTIPSFIFCWFHLTYTKKVNCFVLYHYFLFCSVSFHSVPFCSIPFHSVPFRSIPFHSVPFRSIPFRSVPFCSVLDFVPFVFVLCSMQ